MPPQQKDNRKDTVRVNERIRFSPVRVIGADGAQIGIIPTRQALDMALRLGLDLVEVAPQARPPVCRILDYGKFKYEQGIKEKEAKQRQKPLKEMRFRPATAQADVETKCRAIQKFLADEQRVQLRIRFEKRENAHKDLGFKLISDIIEQLKDYGTPQSPPRMDGRDITCILDPVGN